MRNTTLMRSWLGSWCLCIAIGVSPLTSRAAESVVPITPPGSTDVDQAILPPEGLYGGVAVLPFNQNSHAYDPSGHALPTAYNLRLNLQLYVGVLAYVYPFKLFGGTVASVFVQPVEHLQYNLATQPLVSEFGLADAYTDVFYWTKNVGLFGATPGPGPVPNGLSVGAGLALIVPDGGYTTKRALNLGSHSWVLDPNFALTYNTGPKLSFGDNTQLSARLFYGIPTKNTRTNYTTGNIVDVDWSATQQFGLWRFGVAGYYQAQVTDDNPGNGGSLPNGNKYSEAAIGPVVEYFIPKWHTFIKAKYQYTFYHRNYVNEQFLVVSTGFKF